MKHAYTCALIATLMRMLPTGLIHPHTLTSCNMSMHTRTHIHASAPASALSRSATSFASSASCRSLMADACVHIHATAYLFKFVGLQRCLLKTHRHKHAAICEYKCRDHLASCLHMFDACVNVLAKQKMHTTPYECSLRTVSWLT
jgi:hypothetical protein